MADVVFISMPFGPLLWPSFGLSLLKGGLSRAGIDSEILYFTLPFAEEIGETLYLRIADGGGLATTDLVGEWIFSSALVESGRLDDEGYINNVLRAPARGRRTHPVPEPLISRLVAIRDRVEHFLDECVAAVLARRPRLIGFSSVFQQQMASLALAKRLKEQLPDSVIVFGGANCEGTMGAEVLRRFPFIDAVVSGEGDLVVPELVARVLDGKPLAGLLGVRHRDSAPTEGGAASASTAPPVERMDELPYADYGDFFNQFRASRFERRWLPGVFFETARGCWWGEKQHCTFCGLNGETMRFRSKSAARAVEELLHLSRTCPGSAIFVTDNILDMAYFRDFLPQLKALKLNLNLFFETKANLRRDQVQMLRDAGVRSIQPGIESFSDTVLRMMRKGVTGIQNVQLLKWCKEIGVPPVWNVLWGFPGEPEEDYAQMADLIPLLTHLPPPGGFGSIRIDRFSPNYNQAAYLGFAAVQPLPAYRYIYAFEPEAVANLAYFFDYDYSEPRDVAAYTGPLRHGLEAWQRAHSTSDLFSVDVGCRLLIWDFRPVAREALTVLTGLDREVYLECDAVQRPGTLTRTLEERGIECTMAAVQAALDRLGQRCLMLRNGDSHLSLAVPLGRYSPNKSVRERMRAVLKQKGRQNFQGYCVRLETTGASAQRRRVTPNAFRWDQRTDELIVAV